MPQSTRESKHPEDGASEASASKVPAETLITLMARCGAIRRQLSSMADVAPNTQSPAVVGAIDDLLGQLNGLRDLVRYQLDQVRAERAIAAGSLDEPLAFIPDAMLEASAERIKARWELRAAIGACECKVQPSFRHGCTNCESLRAQLAATL